MPLALLHLVPYVAIALLAVAGWGLWEQHKVDHLKLDQANAQLIQNQKDAAVSARQIAIAETKLENLNVKAQPIFQTIMAAPQTSGCGPSIVTALDGVRSLRAARDATPGPKPAQPTALSGPGAALSDIKAKR